MINPLLLLLLSQIFGDWVLHGEVARLVIGGYGGFAKQEMPCLEPLFTPPSHQENNNLLTIDEVLEETLARMEHLDVR